MSGFPWGCELVAPLPVGLFARTLFSHQVVLVRFDSWVYWAAPVLVAFHFLVVGRLLVLLCYLGYGRLVPVARAQCPFIVSAPAVAFFVSLPPLALTGWWVFAGSSLTCFSGWFWPWASPCPLFPDWFVTLYSYVPFLGACCPFICNLSAPRAPLIVGRSWTAALHFSAMFSRLCPRLVRSMLMGGPFSGVLSRRASVYMPVSHLSQLLALPVGPTVVFWFASCTGFACHRYGALSVFGRRFDPFGIPTDLRAYWHEQVDPVSWMVPRRVCLASRSRPPLRFFGRRVWFCTRSCRHAPPWLKSPHSACDCWWSP